MCHRKTVPSRVYVAVFGAEVSALGRTWCSKIACVMHKAPFVVVEGIDGAGTTTQTRRLVEGLRQRNIAAIETREPTDGPIGMLLRQMLKGRIVSARGVGAPDWQELALLFAADRVEHVVGEIEPRRQQGVWVISDRYDYSNIVYQSASAQDTAVIDWLRTLNRYVPRPDLTLVIDVTPEVAEARRLARGSSQEIFDQAAFQAKLAAFYREIDRFFPEDCIVHVPGDGDVESVYDVLLDAVLSWAGTR